MKKLFKNLNENVTFDTSSTVLILNDCKIEAYPSHHIDAMRGLTDVKAILLDEAAFFPPNQQQEVRDVAERYIAKSDPFIIMISTPNSPFDMFAKIEQEQVSIYERIKMGYDVGLGKIYNEKEIEEAKKSPSFEREYNLKFQGLIGNVFTPSMIDDAIELGEQYKDIPINVNNLLICGVDPAFGSSSKSALVMVELNRELDLVRVVLDEEWNQPTPSELAKYMFSLHTTYYKNLWFYVDGSGRGLINEAKVMFGESLRWDKEKDVTHQANKIIPINFMTEHKKLLEHTHYLIAKGRVAIPKSFDNLIISLRTAYAQEWSLDKEQSIANDHLDAARLALREIKFAE